MPPNGELLVFPLLLLIRPLGDRVKSGSLRFSDGVERRFLLGAEGK